MKQQIGLSQKQTMSRHMIQSAEILQMSVIELDVIEYIIFSLDSRGYYTDGLDIIMDKFHIGEDEALRLLKEIQKLEPAGVGAGDLTECLLLQAQRQYPGNELMLEIIRNHIKDMAGNKIPCIAKHCHCSIDDILSELEKIRSFNPKPGNAFSDREYLQYVTPDVVVVKLEDHFEILINEYSHPGFTINTYYQSLHKSTNDDQTKKYLTDKIQQAKWVTGCIDQRTSTLSRIMSIIVELQKDFFLNGPGHKSPMLLVDIADRAGLHESTVSRALRSKFLQCTWGVFPLNCFLTAVVNKSRQNEKECTPEQVKSHITAIVDSEDKQKPLSDQMISKRLEEQDVFISRRTVNKYRTEMNIPDKSGRKSWEK